LEAYDLGVTTGVVVVVVCVDDVGQLAACFGGFLQAGEDSGLLVSIEYWSRIGRSAYSDGLAGSMITASFVLSSVTKSEDKCCQSMYWNLAT
jgi:hypothetical protein